MYLEPSSRKMPALDNPIPEWRHAYRVLGVSSDASAHAIKSAYRALVKRWHPDRYPPNTRDHADASQMTVLINQAYSAVQYAPLRYASSSRARANAESSYRPQASGPGQYNRAPTNRPPASRERTRRMYKT
jgi:curved DNA-binding protein CbpA